MTEVEPFKVGFLDEGLFPDEESFDQAVGRPLRLRFDEAVDRGELDRPVRLVVRTGRGLPHGSAHAVRQAWTSLADEGVLVILGPGITDNCIAVTPLFESCGVPTINFPGTTRSRGRYGFHYQVGSLYDDGPLIARAIVRRGLESVAVIRDRSPIGTEYFDCFERECERVGLAVGLDLKCSPVASDLNAEVKRAAQSRPDALVYLGFGAVLLELSRCLTASGWDPPRFTTTAGMHFHSKPVDERRQMEGWVYVDQIDETNVQMQSMLDRYEKRYGTRPFQPLTAAMYDMATLTVLGLRYATVHTPDGVTDGLERISQVESVLGGSGTVMGFGPWERTALKGGDYLILREMRGDQTIRYDG